MTFYFDMKSGIIGFCAVSIISLAMFSTNDAKAGGDLSFFPCSAKPEIQSARSSELQKLYDDDQSDYRKDIAANPGAPFDLKKMEKMGTGDLIRRKRVGEILAEGCFKTASDYRNAAMIYQHGNSPDHFFQAYVWSEKAVELGDTKEKQAVAQAVDRYLVSVGHKQLFGSQLYKDASATCYCLQPTEESFPNSTREQYLKPASYGLTFLNNYNGNKNCPKPTCDTKLLPSPQGTVTGFW
jgi:hypothetical protein